MVGGGGARLLCLSRRAHKHARSFSVPPSCCRTLATRLAPAQPEGPDDMGDGGQAGGTLAPQAPDIPSLAVSTLPRQTPKVGAVCGNAARTVLCGGARSNARPLYVAAHSANTDISPSSKESGEPHASLWSKNLCGRYGPASPSSAVHAVRYPGTRQAADPAYKVVRRGVLLCPSPQMVARSE